MKGHSFLAKATFLSALCTLAFIAVALCSEETCKEKETCQEPPQPPSTAPEGKGNDEGVASPESVLEEEDGFAVEDGVYVLNTENFDSFIEKNPVTLVEFYAPWCGHCKALTPQYAKAASTIKGPDQPEYLQKAKLAKVDCTVEKKLHERFNVTGFPTLKFWGPSALEPVDFDGDRHAAGLVSWLKERADPEYKPIPDEAVNLTVETFDEFIGDKPITLVEFYAPWCGHCKRLKPEYERAAKILKGHGIPIAKVDATVEKKLGELYGVEGYPTLKMFRMGRRFDYEGPRTTDGIVDYMLEQAKPAAQLLSNMKEVKEFMDPMDVTVIGVFPTPQGHLFDAFMEAAERTRGDFTTGYIVDAGLIKEMKDKGDTIVLHYPEVFWSKYEPRKRTYDKPRGTAEELIAFYREWAIPLVGQKTRKNSATRYTKLPLVVVYYNVDFSREYRNGTQYWRNKVVEITQNPKFKNANFRYAIADEDEFQRELADSGLGDSGLEQNVIVFGADGKRYPMSPDEYEDTFEENIVAFLSSLNKGQAKQYVRSAPAPKEESQGPVKKVVASTFDSIVNDETKDVLLVLNTIGCDMCDAFERMFEKFAAKHQDDTNLVFAKIDVSSNEVPKAYEVPPSSNMLDSYPYLFFAVPGKKKEPVRYKGNKALDDMLNFMKKNAVKSFQHTGSEGMKKEEL